MMFAVTSKKKFRLFADDSKIYRKIFNIKDVAKLQTALDGLGFGRKEMK